MAILLGIDLIEVERIKRALEKWGQVFKNRVFTKREIDYCENRNVNKYRSYSVRFAAKEAMVKALGTGMSEGMDFKDIEILNNEYGKPYIVLEGKAKEYFSALNGKNISLSISHCKFYAVACVIIETGNNSIN